MKPAAGVFMSSSFYKLCLERKPTVYETDPGEMLQMSQRAAAPATMHELRKHSPLHFITE